MIKLWAWGGVALALLSGCGALQTGVAVGKVAADEVVQAQHRQYDIDLVSEAALNTNAQQVPHALKVVLYQLSDAQAFTQASYYDLLSNDQQVLGDSLLHRQEQVLLPFNQARLASKMAAEAQFLGLAFFFNQPDQGDGWKMLIPRQALRLLRATQIVVGSHTAVSSRDQAQALLKAQKAALKEAARAEAAAAAAALAAEEAQEKAQAKAASEAAWANKLAQKAAEDAAAAQAYAVEQEAKAAAKAVAKAEAAAQKASLEAERAQARQAKEAARAEATAIKQARQDQKQADLAAQQAEADRAWAEQAEAAALAAVAVPQAIMTVAEQPLQAPMAEDRQ
ncbi:MAG: type VI secretion system lipoprotein TssJ [Neisseriaceae bacterium]|nr:type VI secretion system lipoprotein TssJ [Neisseriaceae bacterium]MBP6863541.1 type VI secretion system lipoprotein TssJ [Neisseriaceae bacterium]